MVSSDYRSLPLFDIWVFAKLQMTHTHSGRSLFQAPNLAFV